MNTDKSNKATENESNPEKFIPQEDFLRSLYAVTQHWHSDVKFFEDELNFFRLLIDKHLALLIDAKNIEQTRTMVSHVLDLEKDRVLLENRINIHTHHIADLIENNFVRHVHDYRSEHTKLEIDFLTFVNKYRSVKGEVFKLTERVLRSEKAKRLIDWG